MSAKTVLVCLPPGPAAARLNKLAAGSRTVRVATTPHTAIASYVRDPVNVLLVDTEFVVNPVRLFGRHRHTTTAVIIVDSGDDTMIATLLGTLTGLPLAAVAGAPSTWPGLTVRELQVLRGICDGMSNRAIAHWLAVSIDTVKSHIRRILQKTGADNRAAAAAAAIRNGWVS